MQNTALILGGSGRFGHHMSLAFRSSGWKVKQFSRSNDNLMQAAEGTDVIVAGWNPPYHRWAREVAPLHAQIRAAALAHNATVVLPGNVYVFGETNAGRWTEATPHLASNPLGVIRREMEAAYEAEGVQTILIRAGDFIDIRFSGNWFDRILLPTLPKGYLTYPGRTDVKHAWAFLPDLARATVALTEMRHDLSRFEDIPFSGYTLTGAELAAAIGRANGTEISTRQMNWWPLKLARPVMPMARGLLEMRYLWNTGHMLDETKLNRLLPGFECTPVEKAMSLAQVNPDQPVAAGADHRVMT